MLGRNKPGFTLIELVVVMAILALLAVVAIPNLFKRKPSYEQKAFVTGLNAFMADAWQRGDKSQKIEKIVFDMNQHKVFLEEETNQYDAQGARIFAPVVVEYGPPAPSWPQESEIQQFFVQGADELSAQNRQTNSVWFFIQPGGLSQEVIINMVVLSNPGSDHEGKKVGLVLNPFNSQFKTYDEFRSPE